MRYLTLSADYLRASLRDDGEGGDQVDLEAMSPSLARLVDAWNNRYEPVVKAESAERSSTAMATLIDALDAEGLSLTERIVEAVGPSKVGYYSEGLARLVGQNGRRFTE